MTDSTKLIIPFGNLDDILSRLNACNAVLYVIHSDMGDSCSNLSDALWGAADLLKSIIRDLQADVDGADEATA